MSAISGIETAVLMAAMARPTAVSGTATRTISHPAASRRRIWATVAVHVLGGRVGHGLHGDGCAIPDGHVAHPDPAGFFPLYAKRGFGQPFQDLRIVYCSRAKGLWCFSLPMVVVPIWPG